MPRKRTGRRRGRPRQDKARRRETTRAGRRGEPYLDRGTLELLAHRRQATTVEDLPADPLGILLGHDLIDKHQYAAGRDVGELLAIAHSGFGLNNGAATVWLRILAGGSFGGGGAVDRSALAERAERILDRLRRRVGAELAILVFAVAEGEWCPALDDYPVLALLRRGLDQVTRSWSSGRDLKETA